VVDPKTLTGFEKTALIAFVSVTAHFLLLTIFTKTAIKDSLSRGAFIQGCFRSNYALIGVPLAINLFGQEGAVKSSIILAVVLPLFIVYSVIILSINNGTGEKSKVSEILLKIVKNPYIIAVFLGLLFSFSSLRVPNFLGKTMDYMANIATPLALLTIGAFLNTASMKSNFKLALSASLIKTVLVPLVSLPVSILAGLRNADLGVLFILYTSPAAVSSFIMAKGMKSDASLAANIIVISTAISCFTVFIGVLILKNLGFI
ncbi:MAG TPA: AEC family transporter, partial [Clostridiales bacterium]|nr:AEC family transporter [Clostridiales bacterium]